MKRSTKKLVLSVIDKTTGTVLSPENLFAVLSTEKQADKACNSDSEAFDLATKRGSHIFAELLHAVVAKKLTKSDVYAVANVFGFAVARDNTGQFVLYTDVKGSK
jgi:hypothetical protein